MKNHNLMDGAAPSSQNDCPYETETLDAFVARTCPRYPVSVLRPHVLTQTALRITNSFPGRVLYAVKCNPDERVLASLIAGGVDSFDCASIGEIRLIRRVMPEAVIYFMHPIKARESIREAYFEHDIRAFVLDSADELKKILEETDHATDLKLFVRMAVPKQKVATDFSAKFGAAPMLAGQLLSLARPHCASLGLSFHVGTHCLDTGAYAHAVSVAAGVIAASGVTVEAMDIGGGFPAELDPSNPSPSIEAYFKAVTDTLAESNLSHLELLCEPGRGMVAGGGALVVRVEGRKGDLLYINDGTYGGIFEGGGAVGLPYPARLIRRNGLAHGGEMLAFRLAGPTCDSVDMLNGPFMLPADIAEGDHIVLDQLGAYGEVSRTPFNGFDEVIRWVEPDNAQSLQQTAKAA